MNCEYPKCTAEATELVEIRWQDAARRRTDRYETCLKHARKLTNRQ